MYCLNTSKLKTRVPLTASLNLSNDSKVKKKTSFTSRLKDSAQMSNSKTSLKRYLQRFHLPLENKSLEELMLKAIKAHRSRKDKKIVAMALLCRTMSLRKDHNTRTPFWSRFIQQKWIGPRSTKKTLKR